VGHGSRRRQRTLLHPCLRRLSNGWRLRLLPTAAHLATLLPPPAPVLDAGLESHDQRAPLCVGSTAEVAKCLAAMQAA
jgi:hypothetical protein